MIRRLRNSRYTIFICANCPIISKVLPTPSVLRHRILVPYVPLRVSGSANVPALIGQSAQIFIT